MFDIKYEDLIKANTSSALKFYWDCAKGFRLFLFFDIFYSFLNSLLKVLSIVVFSNLIGYFSSVSRDDFDNFKALYYVFLVLVIFCSINGVRFIRESISEKTRSMLSWRARIFAFEYVSKYSLSHVKEQKAGVIAQRIRAIGENIYFLTFSFARLSSCLFLIAIPIIFIGNKNVSFMLIVFVLGIFSALFSFIISKNTAKLYKRTEEKEAKFNGYVADSLTNILLIKTFGEEKSEEKKLNMELKALKAYKNKTVWTENIIFALQQTFLAFFRIITVVLALYLWRENKIKIADVITLLLLVNDVIPVFSRFMFDITNTRSNIAKLSDSLKIMQVPLEIVDNIDAKKLMVKNGEIEFKNISFGYNADKLIFDKFNLKIKPKEKIGIVGKSGGGKSTLISLLQRNYDLNDGSILIDGEDISTVTLSSLKKNITVIGQDSALFHRSIKKNIAYSNPNSSMKNIIVSSKLACADDFICETPYGYNTITGERGIKLSGGQRQRIAIARAILKNSTILILDEVTSALDNKTENDVIETLNNLMKNKTVITIAHRLSTLKNMDRIIVIDKGKIVEDGHPLKLLSKEGEFQKFWKLQK
ncbi:MAG: ABC transporter ATP-binding protein [Alphaproteobacteria bacterium]|nr:ABC transporter ATP-binding protein [Alphaproteobacteria bacterium]